MRKQVYAVLLVPCLVLLYLLGIHSRRSPSGDESVPPQFGASEAAGSELPPAENFNSGPIPPTFFSMSVQSGIFKGTPWPTMPIGGIRLWDTFTNWSDLEPSRGNYNWPALDRWLDAAQAHGADVLYTFGDIPSWASSVPNGKCDYNPGGCYPPLHMQDWDDFVRALATHAAGRIKYWELWNEANQHEYWSGGIPTLVVMAQHAYTILK
ncbi:MAG: hypothetical protein ACRD4Y_07245, partial [Candidatus Acidiferrales bacterium]